MTRTPEDDRDISKARYELGKRVDQEKAARNQREANPTTTQESAWQFKAGDRVRKKSGSWWEGIIVGTYSTDQTPRGYAVQLDKPFGPVQIYPESALEEKA